VAHVKKKSKAEPGTLNDNEAFIPFM